MIRFACPKCAKTLTVNDSLAGTAVACRSCGQKFRVPASPGGASAKAPNGTVAQPNQAAPQKAAAPAKGPSVAPSVRKAAVPRPPDEPEEVEYDAVYDEEEPKTPAPPRKRPPKKDADDAAADADHEPEAAEDEDERPRKKKKKKKKKKGQGGLTAVHVALIVVALVVVGGITGVVFLIQKGKLFAPKPPPDPAAVLAELKQVGAMIGYDNTPEKNVVSISLASMEFPAALLGKLNAFPSLEKLDLGHTLTSDVKLEHLKNVTSLKVLNLSHTKVTGGGLQFLSKMTNLEELYLASTLATDAGLENLKGCTKLKRITLDGTLANGEGLRAVIPGLEISR